MVAYNPPITLHITFRLLFTTGLGPILAKLQELTTAYDHGFRYSSPFWSPYPAKLTFCYKRLHLLSPRDVHANSSIPRPPIPPWRTRTLHNRRPNSIRSTLRLRRLRSIHRPLSAIRPPVPLRLLHASLGSCRSHWTFHPGRSENRFPWVLHADSAGLFQQIFHHGRILRPYSRSNGGDSCCGPSTLRPTTGAGSTCTSPIHRHPGGGPGYGAPLGCFDPEQLQRARALPPELLAPTFLDLQALVVRSNLAVHFPRSAAYLVDLVDAVPDVPFIQGDAMECMGRRASLGPDPALRQRLSGVCYQGGNRSCGYCMKWWSCSPLVVVWCVLSRTK